MLIFSGSVPEESHGVVVLGTGLGGMTAAVAAREAGAEVLVLEKAPLAFRAGNTRFAGGGLRHVRPDYSEETYYNDLMRITRGRASPELARMTVHESADVVQWLTDLGVEWEPPEMRPDSHGKPVKFAKRQPFDGHRGGGNGLINMLIDIAERMGIRVLYETKGEKLLTDLKRRVIGMRALGKDGYRDYRCQAVVLACGNFNANIEMRVRYVGRFADELILRGSRFNTGDGLNMALEIGAQPAGQWGDHHSAVIDARSPKVEAGETNINTYPFTIMVNKQGKRFLDEGANFQHDTYTIYGKALLALPEGMGFCICDATQKDSGLVFGLREEHLPPYKADTIEELARVAGIDAEGLRRTVNEYNAAVQPGKFNPDILDGKYTKGIQPPKSNWALKIEVPPFYAFPVTGGYTFGFGGLKINTRGQVLDLEGGVIPGLYAAGEIVGEILYYNYPGGTSLTRAAVTGRSAGKNAAREKP